MERGQKSWRLRVVAYSLLAAASFLYIYLSYKTHVSLTGSDNEESLGFRLTIALPEIIIWAIATLSAVRFKEYTLSIQNSKDGKGLNLIADSLILLVCYVVVLTTINSVVRLFAGSPYLKTAVILGNHIPIIFALASSFWLYRGAKRLCALIDVKIWTHRRRLLFWAVSALIVLAFAWRFYHQAPNIQPTAGIPRFAMSAKVLLFSYVAPHIILWMLGVTACINLAAYGLKSRGEIYRSLFQNLYRGLLLVFVCTFLAQLIISSSVDLTRFNFMLATIYVVLVLTTVGFVLVFRGTRDLSQIETLHKLSLGRQKSRA